VNARGKHAQSGELFVPTASAAEQSGDCDQLARVNQFFSVSPSPYIACTMISPFREELRNN
jgi:hypothetical protein